MMSLGVFVMQPLRLRHFTNQNQIKTYAKFEPPMMSIAYVYSASFKNAGIFFKIWLQHHQMSLTQNHFYEKVW